MQVVVFAARSITIALAEGSTGPEHALQVQKSPDPHSWRNKLWSSPLRLFTAMLLAERWALNFGV